MRKLSHKPDDMATHVWLDGNAAGGRPVKFLADASWAAMAGAGGGEGEGGRGGGSGGGGVVFNVGFAEMKEALLREVLGREVDSPWRKDVEMVFQKFVGELQMVERSQGAWLDAAGQEQVCCRALL
jgi:hypothetical protein